MAPTVSKIGWRRATSLLCQIATVTPMERVFVHELSSAGRQFRSHGGVDAARNAS